jgi:hypothetical protein
MREFRGVPPFGFPHELGDAASSSGPQGLINSERAVREEMSRMPTGALVPGSLARLFTNRHPRRQLERASRAGPED